MYIYHAITGAPDYADESFVRALILKDLVLVPLDQRKTGTQSATGLIDRLAGDGQYIFFSPIRPLQNFVTLRKPVFRFDARLMWRQYRPVFRVQDMTNVYSGALEYGKTVKKIRDFIDSDAADIELPSRSYECELLAKVATQTDTSKAFKLLQYIGQERTEYLDSLPAKLTEQEFEAVVEQFARPKKIAEYREALKSAIYRLYHKWDKGPDTTSEILIPSKVRLNDAESWSVDMQTWYPV